MTEECIVETKDNNMEYLSSLPQNKTQEVLSVVNRFIKLWHTKDAVKFGEIFTSDAEFTDIVNQIARGKNEIIDQHGYPFTTVNKLAEFTISKVYLRSIADGLVLVTGDWALTKAQSPTGEPLPNRNGLLQMICKQEPSGEWKISLVHNTDLSKVYQKMMNTEMRFYDSTGKKVLPQATILKP